MALIFAVVAATVGVNSADASRRGHRGETNTANIYDNSTTAVANSGGVFQYQGQDNDADADADGRNADADANVEGGDQDQYVDTGNADADATTVIVANVDACGCEEDGRGHRGSERNTANVYNNDTSATANSGLVEQIQGQENDADADADTHGRHHRRGRHHGSAEADADVEGGDQTQTAYTGNASADAESWTIVNVDGSLWSL